MGLIAELLGGALLQGDVGVELVVPIATEGALPVDADLDGDAVAAAGREAGGGGVLVGEAEVVEDVGGVEVGVVVFELEVVGLAVPLRDRRRLQAEAESAREVVPRVGAGGAAGEAFDFAEFNLAGGEGVDGGEEREGYGDGSDGRHHGLLGVYNQDVSFVVQVW